MAEMLNSIDINILPTLMRLLIRIIGLSETIKLIEAYGGTRIRIPEVGLRDNKLCKVLTAGSVVKLCNSDFSGHRITLPKADSILKQLRNIAILAERGKKSKNHIAREFNLHPRHVQRIWNGQADDNPTMDMFS